MANGLPEKLPPQSIEAEQSLLGSLMLDRNAIIKVADFLMPQDFYRGSHQEIYRSCQELFEKGEPIDLLSLANRLKERGELEEVGGNGYLTELVNSVPTASHVLNYGKIIQRKKILRDLIEASHEIGLLGYDEGEDTDLLLDEAEKKIFGIAQRSLSQNFVPIKDTLEEAFERIDKLSKHQAGLRGLPTGFTDLDNLLAGLQKSDLIILAARPTLGKCVSKDAEIINPNPGSVCTIEELIKNKKSEILTLNDNLKISKTRVSDFIDNGIRPVFEVKTALGREIETTITHPFLTINGWKLLEELKPGDKIAVPRKIPVFGKTILPDYKIKSLAYFISEGGLTNRSPRFTNSNKYIVKDFIQNIQSFPRIKVRKDGHFTYCLSGIKENSKDKIEILAKKLKKYTKKSEITHTELAKKTNLCFATISLVLNGHCLPLPENFIKIINSLKLLDRQKNDLLREYRQIMPKNSVAEWLKSFGLMGKHSREKFIPQIVFTFDKKTLALFLNRLFSGDGVLYEDKKGSFHLSYSSSSKKLTKQVQHLLLRFGVISKLRKKRIKTKSGIGLYYELEVHNSDSLSTFIKEIGIYGNEKKLKKAEKKLSKIKPTWTQDTLPIEVWRKILEIKGGRSWYSIYPGLGLPKNYNIHAFRRCPRRDTIAKLAKVFQSQELKNHSRSDIYWDKIVSVKYVGEKQVYDLTIPETHNFIANDFIIHNSALALNIAASVAINVKIPVGIFSLEMSKDQIADRLIASLSNVDLWRLRTGRLSAEGDDNDFSRIQDTMGILSEAPLYIDDAASPTVLQMKAMSRRLQAEKGLGLIIIDYLQLMEPLNPAANPVQQVSENSRALKALARELNIPVLVISQLSRAVEMRSPQIPRLSDLRQSGTIEQDADVVMFIYREDRYRPETPRKNIADIIVAKHRNGPVGRVELYFEERNVTFRNLEKGYLEE